VRTVLSAGFSTTGPSAWNVENSRSTTSGGGTTLIRRTKIVATLGPATGTPDGIAGLIGAGANVIRVNASHGTPEMRAGWIAEVRRAAEAADVAVAVLVDLQGPRIRVGNLPTPRVLRTGETVVFAPEDLARDDELPTTYADLAADVRPGARVLLDDGLLSLEVTRIAAPRVEGRVVDGGTLTAHKGMNLPGLHVSAPALTEKDREDAAHAVAAGTDFLALSFVRRAEDMGELRALVPPEVKLIAKIEKATALDDLGRILEASDAVMVARGDLGVELPFEEVPVVQKRLIREASRYGKPVITATQMLESMVHNPRPTRAEASDVANAILDGTDAVMLSAETAVGKYPFESVRAMDRIIREMERQGPVPGVGSRDERRLAPGETVSVEDAIAIGTSAVARMLRTPLIVTLTSGGFTSRKVAALRTPVPILAVTTQAATYRQLALVWGVTPVLVDRVPGYDAMLAVVRDLILKRGYARAGDRIVMTAGLPWEVSGTTNLLKVEVV
jgi:pyruvate kinase